MKIGNTESSMFDFKIDQNLIDFLKKEKVYDKFIFNLKCSYKIKKDQDATNYFPFYGTELKDLKNKTLKRIDSAFTWTNSEEGFDFWESLNYKHYKISNKT